MKALSTAIPQITLRVDKDNCWIRSSMPIRVIGSPVVGSDLEETGDILSIRVPRNFDCSDPEKPLMERAKALGIEGPFAGLMTAIPSRERGQVSTQQSGGRTAIAIATVGISNASTPGFSGVYHCKPGTVNLVVLLDADLDKGAMVRAATLAAEAKALAFFQAGVKGKEGLPATGTSTDVIIVGCTGRGPSFRYAGPATLVGNLLSMAVYRAVSEGIQGEQM